MLRRFCKTSREVLLGSTCSSRYGSNASGPVVGTVLGAGQPRGGPYGRCRGAAARPATLRAAIRSALVARKLAFSSDSADRGLNPEYGIALDVRGRLDGLRDASKTILLASQVLS